ncbi:hypothetical protein PoB_005650700 [Plakobranchus ocellatus]|uniref:Uncharacterized protein n=1 Tax=Plakobranchus ocellatus TaxID=259542 RepID=A0AAV4CFH4_9GAST|nr:hypothetical protein PoB_005650700 [Plakobranchus ocellatus]
MANYLIMPYANNNQDPTPGSPMFGLSVGPTLHFIHNHLLHVCASSVLYLSTAIWSIPGKGLASETPAASLSVLGKLALLYGLQVNLIPSFIHLG